MSTTITTTKDKDEAGGTVVMLPEGNKGAGLSSLPESSKKERQVSLECCPVPQPQPLQPGRRVRHVLALRPQGDMRSFASLHQLVTATKNVAEGIQALYTGTGLFQGDVHPHNIVMDEVGGGTLIGWDIRGGERFFS